MVDRDVEQWFEEGSRAMQGCVSPAPVTVSEFVVKANRVEVLEFLVEAQNELIATQQQRIRQLESEQADRLLQEILFTLNAQREQCRG